MAHDDDTSPDTHAGEDYLLRLAMAVNRRMNSGGLIVRLACLLTLVGASLAGGSAGGLRALTFLPGLLGLALAALELRTETLDAWRERSGALGRLAGHLVDRRERAAVSLSGTLEGVGVLAAVLLVGGPAPLRLPDAAHAAALAAFTLYLFDVALQIVLDAGYYNELQPADTWMRITRAVLPPALAAAVAGLLVWSPAVPVLAAVLLGVTMLLLWPLVAVVGTVYRCGRAVAVDWVSREQAGARDDKAAALHHIKGRLRAQLNSEKAAAPDDRSPNELVYQRLRAAIEAERRRAASGNDWSSVAEVWSDALTMEGLAQAAGDGRLTLHDETGEVTLGLGDAILLRHLLLDLADNALRHGAPPVRVRVWLEPLRRAGRFTLRLAVQDSGPGYRPPTSLPPTSSLASLQRLVAGRRGTWALGPGEDGGTTADISYPVTAAGRPPAAASEPAVPAVRSLAEAPA